MDDHNPKRSSWFKRVGLTLICLGAAGILGVVGWMWLAGSRFDRRVEALRAAGQPVSLADLRGKPVDPEKNAAVFLDQAQPGLLAIGTDVRAAEEAVAEAAARAREDALVKDDPSAADENADSSTNDSSEEETPESVLKAIRESVKAHPDVLPSLVKAAECPEYSVEDFSDCGIEVEGKASLNTRWENNWLAVRLLVKYVNDDLIAEGRRDEAMGSCIVASKLSRHYENEPTLVGFLSAMRCRQMAFDSADKALQSGKVSPDARKALEEEVAKHDTFKAYRQSLVTERASMLDAMRSMRQQNWGTAFLVNREGPECLDFFEEFLARADALAKGVTPGPLTSPQGIFPGLLIPVHEASERATLSKEAQLRALRILLALQRRSDPDAAAPGDLGKLGLPREATLDPFNGKPLVVKRVDGGWLIYSVGQDLADDGGSLEDAKDIGLAPPKKPGRPKPSPK